MTEEKKSSLNVNEEGSADNLTRCDFSALIAKLQHEHFHGTREWLFDEVRTWLSSSKRVFWLVGPGGTGKSVVSAMLFSTEGVKHATAAWHFCRHDNAAESSVRVIIESWAAMLCANVAGFVLSAAAKSKALAAETTTEMLEILIVAPLKQLETMQARSEPLMFVLDALDELPRASLMPVLDLIVDVFTQLPSFVRLFVTSRGEEAIKARLRGFDPMEISVNEVRNRADVRTYLADLVRKNFKLEVTSFDLEASLESEFKLEKGALLNKLSCIAEAIHLSKLKYDSVVLPVKDSLAFKNVCAIKDKVNPELRQSESDLRLLYEDAKMAHEKMSQLFASKWEAFEHLDGGKTVLSRPVKGMAAEWVDEVIDPGLKGQESAQRKIKNDYRGDASKAKDLVRYTIMCGHYDKMMEVLTRLQSNKMLQVEMMRNKYATPSLLGYRDFNLSIRVKLTDTRSHICELQVNLKDMVTMKKSAHIHYEEIRTELPAICDAAGISAQREEFEASLFKMLRRSALDAAVEMLERKASGLFIYATLLAREVQTEVHEKEQGLLDFSKLHEVPNGLSEIYRMNFDRMVGKADIEWVEYKRAVSIITCTQEPVPKNVVEQVLGADCASIFNSLSMLFPIRDGRFEILHKSVVDWLMTPNHAYSLSSEDAGRAHRELAKVLFDSATEYCAAHFQDLEHSKMLVEVSFALRQVVYHLCAADLLETAHSVVTSFEWLIVRAATGDPSVLLSDVIAVNKIQPQPTTKLVASALRLALRTLYADWKSLPGQLVGRLLGHIDKNDVYALLERVCGWRGPSQGWWCPMQPSLEPAGGSNVLSFVHPEIVTCAQWSVDAKMICSGSEDKKLRVWDAENGKCLATLEGHTGWVTSVAWSSDGKQMCSGSKDSSVRVWDAENGKCLVTLEGHTDTVTSVAWSSNSKQMCSGSNDTTVRVWEVENGKHLVTLEGHTRWVTSVAWSSDNKQICSGGDDKKLRVWDAESGKCLATLEGHTRWVTSVAWSSDSKQICSSSGDSTVRVWDAENGKCLATLEGHYGAVNAVAWSSNSKQICTGGEDTTVCVWEVENGKCLATLEGHTGWVRSVAWSSDSKQICSSSNDTTVRVWDAENGKRLVTLKGHSGAVNSVAWSSDSKQMCSGSNDNTVCVWEVENGKCLATLEGHTDTVRSVAWSSDNKQICSSSNDTTVRVWDAESGKCLATLEGHSGTVNSVAWSSDSKQICSGGDDNKVRVWDAENSKCLVTLEGHAGWVTSVAWSSDSKQICSGSEDNTVRVWEVESRKCLATLEGHTGWVISVAWSSDSKQICSGSQDKKVRVWDVESGKCLVTLEGHTHMVTLVAWSIDSKQICSGSEDNTVCVWDVKSGQKLSIVTNLIGKFAAVPFSHLTRTSDYEEPLGFLLQSRYMLSADERRAFAQVDEESVTIHPVCALGGSRALKEVFLVHSRPEVCKLARADKGTI